MAMRGCSPQNLAQKAWDPSLSHGQICQPEAPSENPRLSPPPQRKLLSHSRSLNLPSGTASGAHKVSYDQNLRYPQQLSYLASKSEHAASKRQSGLKHEEKGLEESLNYQMAATGHEQKQPSNHDRRTKMDDFLPAKSRVHTAVGSSTTPSYASTLTSTTISSMTESELRMSNTTKCTSISLPRSKFATPASDGISGELTVDDAIDMYAAGFDDDDPEKDIDSPELPFKDDVHRRSQRIAEAMSDSILVPPPKLLGGCPSISTTRNSLAIISNEVRPTSSEPDVPCLLPSTSIRDQYGFLKASHHIQKSQYEAWSSSYTAVQERRRKKWYALMQFHELQTFNPTSFPRRSPKTQRFIRKGMPSGWRGAAWYHYSDADKYRAKDPTLYHNLIARSSTSDLSNIDNETIERDLHRTFPENIHFKDPASSVHETPLLISLRRLLRAFAINNPKIGYCQSLNFIAGLLLLFLPEEKAFWMLHVIARDYLPGTHEISLAGANTDLRILMTLLKEHLPGIWTLITTGTPPHQSDGEKTGRQKLPPVSLCCASWFMSLFIGTLPIECTLRIWDILFYEGPHTIFRVAVAIFRLCAPDLKALSLRSRGDMDPGEMFQLIQNYPRGLLDIGNLLKVALDAKGAVSAETIDRLRREARGDRGRNNLAIGRSLTEKPKVKRGPSLWRKRSHKIL